MKAGEIKSARKLLELTQGELAKLLGVSLGSVQMWESGKRNISKNTAKVLNNYINEQSTQSNETKFVNQITNSSVDFDKSFHSKIKIQIQSLKTDYPDPRWEELESLIEKIITNSNEKEKQLMLIEGILGLTSGS